MASHPRLKSFTDRYPYLGPAIWFATLEYFVVQAVVASKWPTRYSLLLNPISDLGNTKCGVYDGRYVCSPRHGLMNLAFVVLGLLMVVGAPLIHQEFLERRLAVVGSWGMAIAGLGTALVGQGGMERVAAYPQTIWLIVFGVYMSANHYVSRRRLRALGLGGSAA